MVFVFIASLFIGTNMSLARNVRKLEWLYSEGMISPDGAYTQPSIKSQVDVSMDCALRLYTSAANYIEDSEVALWSDRLKQQRESYMRWQENNNARDFTISSRATIYAAVADASEHLYAALQNADLTARDVEAIDAYYKDLMSARTLITALAERYNNEVDSMNKSAEVYPARFFAADRIELNLHYSAFPSVSEITWTDNGWGATY